MHLTLRITLALLLSFPFLFSQAQDRVVFTLKQDSALTIPDNYIGQLKQAPSLPFTTLPATAKYSRRSFRPEHRKSYWFVYAINNGTGKKTELGLDAYSDLAEFYVQRASGKVDSCRTGILEPWSKKKEFRTTNVCSFDLDSNETVTVFYRASFTTRIFDTSFRIALYPPALRARKDLLRAEKRYMKEEVTIYNFFAGFFAMASLIYFFFYYIVREKLFLYFGLFVSMLALSSSRHLQYYVIEHPGLTDYIALVGPLSFLAFAFFYREYFQSAQKVPVWDKVLLSLAFLNIGSGIYGAVTSKLFFSSQNIVITVAMIITMSIIPFKLKDKDRQHKYFLLYASLPLLVLIPLIAIVILITRLSGNRVTQDSWMGEFFTNVNYIQLWALAWMVLFFSRTLVKRFTLQREQILRHEAEKQHILLQQEQEKRQLVENLNAELENKVQKRTAELKASLEELKATQSQLIQSEKMASLGEMTAGIAHEIQNPLNFVNNFAELNKELAEELGEAVRNKASDQELQELVRDMVSNADKIQTHGRRAESIVKNMLQHSRTGEGTREETDINALVEEYVKLSFHGFRARDKSFNADFDVRMDPALGKEMVVGQNLGRVLLNLINNAFYAVHTRNKKGEAGYAPKVTVTTKKQEGSFRITVEDNGEGISPNVIDKIFQPFFTTKPTGEGTGLGLSISYDIITKGHQGTLKVESTQGEGTRFIIEIPS